MVYISFPIFLIPLPRNKYFFFEVILYFSLRNKKTVLNEMKKKFWIMQSLLKKSLKTFNLLKEN